MSLSINPPQISYGYGLLIKDMEFHLVACDKITKTKKDGSLGFRMVMESNTYWGNLFGIFMMTMIRIGLNQVVEEQIC